MTPQTLDQCVELHMLSNTWQWPRVTEHAQFSVLIPVIDTIDTQSQTTWYHNEMEISGIDFLSAGL